MAARRFDFWAMSRPNLEKKMRSALNRTVNDSHRASEIFDGIRALFGKADPDHEPDRRERPGPQRDGCPAGRTGKAHGITGREFELPVGLPQIAGHLGQLQEVLINLVRNAIEAMHGDQDSRRVLQVSTQRHGEDKVMIAVKDSGPGIDLKRRTNIFDAFVTSKSQGMGLGLAISRMIVQRHSGQLSAAGASRAALFSGLFYRCNSATEIPMNSRTEPQPTVFVIDDDASLREALSSLFRSVGLQDKALASASEFLANQIAGGADLPPGARCPPTGGSTASISRPSWRSCSYRHSDRVHDRPRRHPHVRASHESGSRRVPNQAVP